MNEVTAKNTYSKIGFTYIGMYWVYAACLALLLLLKNVLLSEASLGSQALNLIDFALRFLIIYPAMYLLIRKLPKFDIEKKKIGVGGFIACLLITAFLMYSANIIGMILNSLIGKITEKGGVNPIANVVDDISPGLMMLIGAVIAPVWEELLFRKFLIDRVRNYGEVTAMLMSGIMFGLFHANFAQAIYACAMGCFWAFIYMRTGKIQITIALHMLINGFSIYLSKFMLRGINISEMQGYLLNGDMEGYMRFIQDNMAVMVSAVSVGMFVILAIIVGLILAIVLRKKFVFEHHEGEIAKGNRFKTAVLNPGMLLYIIFLIVAIVTTQLGISLVDSLLNRLGG